MDAVSNWPAPSTATPVHATVTVPGSKSQTNRALILAALAALQNTSTSSSLRASGSSTVSGALRSRDTDLMISALQALGITVDASDTDDTELTIGGVLAPKAGTRIDCGLAGTVLRFVPPLAALSTESVVFDGDEQARSRPIAPLLDGLRGLGVPVAGDGLPFTVRGAGSVRGGTVEQAWDAFKAGVRNIPGSLRANGKKLDIQEFAESVGTVESQFTVDMLGDMYGSAYMSDWARKTNNLLFRYNLMEGWNTAMRSSATVVALDFIKRHAAGENRNSVRYLDELGLSTDTLVLDEEGNVLWRQADIAQRLLETGRDPAEAQAISRRTREGITRWVDGAVLRPHAAHRPAWASDPHFMLIWHLKQFTYSFHKTIIERVMHETKNGNYNPMLVLASYVPFMIAADYLRGLVQGGGEEPPWRKGMSFGDTVWEGVQRAGLLGIRQFAVDGADNPAFALGPAANYAIDIGVKAADGQVTDALVKALPGNALWKGW